MKKIQRQRQADVRSHRGLQETVTSYKKIIANFTGSPIQHFSTGQKSTARLSGFYSGISASKTGGDPPGTWHKSSPFSLPKWYM